MDGENNNNNQNQENQESITNENQVDNVLNDTKPVEQGIITINISSEMKNCYLAYAMSVIVSRAIPDVRDGLNQFTEEFYMQ